MELAMVHASALFSFVALVIEKRADSVPDHVEDLENAFLSNNWRHRSEKYMSRVRDYPSKQQFFQILPPNFTML